MLCTSPRQGFLCTPLSFLPPRVFFPVNPSWSPSDLLFFIPLANRRRNLTPFLFPPFPANSSFFPNAPLPHLANFLTALFSGCLLSHAPSLFSALLPSFRVSCGLVFVSRILILIYLPWPPRLPSASTQFSHLLPYLCSCACAGFFLVSPCFSHRCFLPFALLLPGRHSANPQPAPPAGHTLPQCLLLRFSMLHQYPWVPCVPSSPPSVTLQTAFSPNVCKCQRRGAAAAFLQEDSGFQDPPFCHCFCLIIFLLKSYPLHSS